jgi:hypothetical protein
MNTFIKKFKQELLLSRILMAREFAASEAVGLVHQTVLHGVWNNLPNNPDCVLLQSCQGY